MDYAPVPLTEEESGLLRDIFRVRWWMFFSVCMGFMQLYFSNFSSMWMAGKNAWDDWNKPFFDQPASFYLGILAMHSAILLPIIGIMSYIFFKRVWPFKKDIRLGMKTPIYYTVIGKSYFPITQQYFISFNDPDYMHHEVDSAWYNSCCEGDTACLYMAPYSKYIFEQNGRFTII